MTEEQLKYLVSLGNKYGASVSDSNKAFLCYDTAIKLALENFCFNDKADDYFLGENGEFGVSIENANEKECRRDDSENPIIPLFVATILNNKAILHLNTGQLDDAYRSFSLSLSIKRLHLHPTHPDVTGMLHNIGMTLQKMRKFERARSAYEECVRLKKHNWIDNCEHLSSTLMNLGMVLYRLNKVHQAIKILEEGLKLSIRFSSHNERSRNADEIINGLHLLGVIRLDCAEYNDALRCFDYAIGLLRNNSLPYSKSNEAAIDVIHKLIDQVKFEMNYDSSSCYSNSRLDNDDASNNTFDLEMNGSSAELSNETSEVNSYDTCERFHRKGPLIYFSVLGGSLRILLEKEFKQMYRSSIRNIRHGFVSPSSSSVPTTIDSYELIENTIIEVFEVELHGWEYLPALLQFYFQCHDPTVNMDQMSNNRVKSPNSYILLWNKQKLIDVAEFLESLQDLIDHDHFSDLYKYDRVHCWCGQPTSFNESHSYLSPNDDDESKEIRLLFNKWPISTCSASDRKRSYLRPYTKTISSSYTDVTTDTSDDSCRTVIAHGYEVVM